MKEFTNKVREAGSNVIEKYKTDPEFRGVVNITCIVLAYGGLALAGIKLQHDIDVAMFNGEAYAYRCGINKGVKLATELLTKDAVG